MPEATVLYAVTGVVVVGLVVWVVAVLRVAKEPWAQPTTTVGGPPPETVATDAASAAASETPPKSESES
jgi:hypothetical protein